VHNGNPPKEKSIMPFSVLLNLVGTSNATDKDVLWKFIKKNKKNIKVSEAKKMMPEIGHGMEKKVIAAIESINMGTNEALISSGLINNPISSALNHEGCTVIVND